MDLQILVIIFIIFSAISSLYKKLKKRSEPDEAKLQRKHPSSDVDKDLFGDTNVDWDTLFGSSKPESEPEPDPELKPEPQREFQEVQGKRPVDEDDTGPEFQEVQGKRPVSDQSSYIEGQTHITRASETLLSSPKKRKRRHHLTFNQSTIQKAVIYNEIIGPPRADNMPF